MVVKPVTGSWGHLTARVHDEEQGRTVLEHRAALPNPQQHVFYLQEHIDKPGRDIKSYVAGGEVVCAIYKNAVDDWRTNTAIGGAPIPARSPRSSTSSRWRRPAPSGVASSASTS